MVTERNLTTSRGQVFGHVEKGTKCRICGRDVTDGRAVYCSDYCRQIANGVMNLLNWQSVRRRIIERDGATCQECGFKQDWLDRGNDFLIDIIKSQLPERPEGPALDEYDEWTDEELEEHRAAYREWREQRDELIGEYFGLTSWRGIQWPSSQSRLEVDHVTPVTDGGHPFDPANLRTLCEDCHAEKTARENSERAEERRYERPDVEQELADYIADGGFLEVADVGAGEGGD